MNHVVLKDFFFYTMASDQSLALDQKITTRLSAQQLRFVKLLELNTPELEEAVDRELEDNPALEALDPPAVEENELPAYRYVARNTSPDDFADYDFTPADNSESLYDHLRKQLSERSLSGKMKDAVDYLIDSLDPNGYLLRPLKSLTNDMAFGPGIELTDSEAEEALSTLQSFEPFGVGATDLRDCLKIQLQHLPESQSRNDALDIITDQFEAFSMKHTHKIISALKIGQDRVKEAIDLILSLNPKPGASFDSTGDATNVIVPDLIIDNQEGQLSVALNNRIPELAIERSFSEAVAEMDKESRREKRKGSEFITTRYNDARDFIRILRQRQETLLSVMTAIMQIQKDYFLTEDVYRLKPMMIKDVSALTGYDLSVISRATANKFVATPWGVFPLRFFFSDSIGETASDNGDDSTEVLTNRKIEAEIADLVEKEDKKHPLSDEKIRQLMEERGYEVSRRTVAKYRDRQNIPVARLRKEL